MAIIGKKKSTALPVKHLLGWLAEAEEIHSLWRQEAWIDSRFRDGKQWSEADRQALIDRKINPLTVNRIFPIINMIVGSFITNQHDITAVGRTSEDAELSQVMSESLQFVMDQNEGNDLVTESFLDQILPGYGCMGVRSNPDPRKEKVKVAKYPWYSIGWDPYGSPWMDPEDTRYAYYSDWKDLDAVAAHYPKKAAELRDKFNQLTADNRAFMYNGILDISAEIEDRVRLYSGNSNVWCDSKRKRIRPAEMWYTVMDEAWFCVMPNGQVLELKDSLPIHQQYALATQANECVKATVQKLRVGTFVSDVLLEDIPSPLPHDRYPFIPFIGYLDSYRQPFGVPRQIRDQQMEVNKRRSMALSLINNRRVIMEKNTAEDHNRVYEEANKQDGLIVLKDGKSPTFQIQELGTMAAQQMEVMHTSEREMQEIVGANNETLGYQTSGSQSNAALETKQQQSSIMTASLTSNLKRSQRMLGERIISHVQRDWTGPKVLRVSDRITGAEKFVELNRAQYDHGSGSITIHNNITQGMYDTVVSDKPMTDTVREKNLELIFSAIQKAPPEALAPLINLAFELSNLPHKDQLLHQLRMTLGVEPIDPLLSSAEADAKAKEKQAALEEQRGAESELEMREKNAEISKTEAEIQKLMAEVKEMEANAALEMRKTEVDAEKVQVQKDKERRESFAQGFQLQQDLNAQQEMTKTKEMEGK